MSELEKKFSTTYQARIRVGNTSFFRAAQRPLTFADSNDDDSSMHTVTEISSVEVTMPVDRFYALLEVEARIRSLMNSRARAGQHPGSTLWEEYKEEVIIRNQCPSVRIAYEKYLTLLELSRR